MANIKCKNCEHIFHGNFCPHCSQSAKVDKINFSYFLHDIPHSIFHIDKGFVFTLKELFTRPGNSLKEYLAGKRVKHFKPFAFVILLSTICTLLIKGLILLSIKQNPTIHFSSNFFSNYISLLIFLMIPILSLVTYLFYRNRQYNYWEHFLINTYLAACLNIFFLLIYIVIFIKSLSHNASSVNYTWFMTLFMTMYGFAFAQLMGNKKERVKSIIRIIFLNFILATIYMTVFSLTELMSPWWNI